MPLPKLIKNIIGNNTDKRIKVSSTSTSTSNNTGDNSLRNGSSTQHTFRQNRTLSHNKGGGVENNRQKASLSQIMQLHSHRNLKVNQQLALAIAMFEKDRTTSLNSRLSYTLDQCLTDDYSLPYFLQYIESLHKSVKDLIICFLQTNCLRKFLKETFNIELHSTSSFTNEDEQTLSNLTLSDSKQLALFADDFMKLYSHFAMLDCDHELIVEDCEHFEDDLNSFFQQFKIEDYEKENDGDNFNLVRLFHLFWKSLHDQIEKKYYESFLRSHFYLKYEMDILQLEGDNCLQLSDILYANTQISSTFLDFMMTEGMKNYVDFLLMYKNFKTYSGQYSDAVSLYDRFFNFSNKNQSANTLLHFNEAIISELEQSITITEQQDFKPECFDKVASILIQYFSRTYLPQFLQSEPFLDYIKHIQSQHDKLKLEMKNHSSSFEPGNNNSDKKEKFKEQDITNVNGGEESHLKQRNLKGQLQFTYIDNYGRMSSLFEPEPVKEDSGSTKLTRVIKKLTLNNEEEKRKEEDDAWRIAESIINDVCSVTIDHPGLPLPDE